MKIKSVQSAVAGLCIAAISTLAQSVASGTDPDVSRGAVFLPEIHLSADISRFFLPKDDSFMKDYFLESEIFIEPIWASYRNFAYLITSFEVNTDMGQKRFANVLFDPRAINFAITTIFEFRPKFAILQFGEDHRCFHKIDRTEFPTVYWNMLYLAAGSTSMRPSVSGPAVISRPDWTIESRLTWYMRWGVFLKGFFDIVTDSNVDFENRRVHEGAVSIRYAAFTWRNSVFSVSSVSRIGLWDERPEYGGGGKTYWQHTSGLDAAIYRGNSGCMLFVNYILDAIPDYPDRQRFSKDQLLELGIRVFL
jgi:hypothetical protein